MDFKTLKMMTEEDELAGIGIPLGECKLFHVHDWTTALVSVDSTKDISGQHFRAEGR